jgi:hypothetical protein
MVTWILVQLAGLWRYYELLPCVPLYLDWIAIVTPFLILYDLYIATFNSICYGDLYVLDFKGCLLSSSLSLTLLIVSSPVPKR